MGGTQSVGSRYFSPILPLLDSPDRTETVTSPYFVLVIRPPQSLVLLFSNPQVQSIVSRRLQKECKSGPKNLGSGDGHVMNDGTYEFHLKLRADGGNLKGAQIFCRLLADLHTHGWKLAASSDLCRVNPRSTLFFRRHRRDLIDAGSAMIGVLVGSSDVIRLIDVPDQLSVTLTTTIEKLPQIGTHVKIVGQEIGGGGGHSIGVEGRTRRFIELVPSEGIDRKLLQTKIMVHIFSHLYEKEYDFYGTVNIEGGADLLLFEKPGTTSERPIRHFFAVDLVDNNLLRAISAPARLPVTFMNCINQHWPHGMSNARSSEPGCHVYTLDGQPWASGTTTRPDGTFVSDGGQDQAFRARRFLSALFEVLNERQCGFITAMQLNRTTGGTSSFIFAGPPETVDSAGRTHRNAWCLSLMSTSSIFLLNAFFLHRGSFIRLKDEMRTLLTKRWPLGLAQGDEAQGPRHYRLNGIPWHASPSEKFYERLRKPPDDHGPNEDLHARGLICAILAVMEIRGHELVCTASVTNKTEPHGFGHVSKSDCDTWFWVETVDFGHRPQPSSAAHEALLRTVLGTLVPVETQPSAPSEATGHPASLRAPTAPILPSAPLSNQVHAPPETISPDESGPPPYEAPPPAYRTVTKKFYPR